MSWMDSWSRPSKHQATPPPQYLLPGCESTPYCHSCGRVIGARKSHASPNSTATPVKYCSTKCRNKKPGKVDREIEDAFVTLLDGSAATVLQSINKGSKKEKGDSRILVPCVAAETLMFGDRHDPEKVFGRKKNRARRGAPNEAVWKSVDMEDRPEPEALGDYEVVDGDMVARMSIRSGTRIRPPQEVSEVNGGVGGEKEKAERIEETDGMLQRRREGQQRANEREMVRCAARRGVAFGFVINKDSEGDNPEERRKCEAVMLGKVVESSFAKGDWSIRWRE
ncbi:hypothetical protein BJ878DRAFT_421839 [Calycina marina]|uniref:Uncharacterized protein n=1 Tax=Calycina marina TaxID=1763456 RepID=A0A9P8CEL9_9HELO|nr:hypothetical protein BJ878DRAFT_421839 [Calycina marina]